MRSVVSVRETPFSRLTLYDDGIVHAHPIQREAPRDAALISETIDALEVVADGVPRPVLWDPAGTLPLRPAGWQLVVERVGGSMAALGIVLDDSEVHLLGSFPESMNSLMIPVRIFDNEESALRWLVQFVRTPQD